jgi:hypothetical protein
MTQGNLVAAGWGMFLEGFVPGLWHFRLGDRKRAVLAFASCALLFAFGYVFVRDRLFYYALLSPDRDSPFALVLRFLPVFNLPEMLNWPCTALAQVLGFHSGFEGERIQRMPRDFEHLGSWITAASGMLAAFWAADAQWRLRLLLGRRSPVSPINPALAAGLSWLVPGLGHWRAGQRDKGVLVGMAVVLVFATGLVASQGHAVDRGIAPVWWIGQDLFGGGCLFTSLVTAPWKFLDSPPYLDLGIVLCTVAGMMNLVVMVDAYTIAERATFPPATPQPVGEVRP